MDTVKFLDKGNIKMIAHRGVSGLERENTNAAFVAARFVQPVLMLLRMQLVILFEIGRAHV